MNHIPQDLRHYPKSHRGSIRLFMVLLALAGATATTYKPPKPVLPAPVAAKQPEKKPETRIVEYLERKGSPQPKAVAAAVVKTKRPELMAAVAVVETGADPKKRNTGYKHRHHGAFQVNPRHWGKVSKDVNAQARQSEWILEELLAENNGDMRKALNAYGGDSRGKYANKVLAELEEVLR